MSTARSSAPMARSGSSSPSRASRPFGRSRRASSERPATVGSRPSSPSGQVPSRPGSSSRSSTRSSSCSRSTSTPRGSGCTGVDGRSRRTRLGFAAATRADGRSTSRSQTREPRHTVPPGEAAKSVAQAERLWRALLLDRRSTLVAVGGGSTTDLAGFVAATYMRGVAWIPVPSTLVGQVDAAIGGKTGIDLPEAKNLVGAFHWPAETVIDTTLLETLPEEEWANGAAEVVKTGLLAGEPLWELPAPEQVRRCAA